jgi:hypothetical protein
MSDEGTEADALSDWWDGDDEDEWDDEEDEPTRIKLSSYTKPLEKLSGAQRNKIEGAHQHEVAQAQNRWRCLVTGCNPKLNSDSAREHKAATGHRVAAWPVRSAEGVRRAKARNRTGYYDQYNVDEKSARNRGIR